MKRIMLVLIAATALAACGSSSSAKKDDMIADKMNQAGDDAADEAEGEAKKAAGMDDSFGDLPRDYYGGISTMQGPDGKMMGATEALIMRVMDKENSKITEVVLVEGELVNVVLTETEEPNVFAVEPEDDSYSGTITFTPDAWAATSWTYDIDFPDGTKVTGEGKNNGEAFHIEKQVTDPSGKVVAKVVERLPKIKEPTYVTKKKALVKK